MGVILTLPVSIVVNIFAALFPGVTKWVKWVISYLYLWFDRCLIKKRFDLYDRDAHNEPYKLGFLVPPQETELESPFDEDHLRHSADEVLCYGVNSKSECLVTRVARGCNQESEAWVYLKLSNGKTYRLPEGSSHHQQPYRDKCTNFSCGGLQMHYITPMRRWRIFYNGLLRESSEGNEDRIVHVKFALLWRASSDPYDFRSNSNNALSAEGLSAAKWKFSVPPVKRLQEAINFYSQGGTVLGTVKVGEDPDREVYLWGSRVRFIGDTADMEGARFLQILGNVKNGSVVHLGKCSIPHTVKDLRFGFVVQSSGRLHTLEKGQITRKIPQKENDGCEDDYFAKFKAGRNYEMDVHFAERVSLFTSSKGWGGSVVINYMNLKLNGFEGSGIVMTGTLHEAPKRSLQRIFAPTAPKVAPLVVPLGEAFCQIPDLTGGKGSSLGKLTEISRDVKTFMVPRGVVVTTAAYREFLNDDIENAVKALESVAYGLVPGDLKSACEETSNFVSGEVMPEKLCHVIEHSLRDIFGDKINAFRFAVRSSATGEDTEQMSAAGQMDTYLGVKGLKEILTSVKKSWASQFGFIAVEYKRRYGQVIGSPMAVVIQEMVPCDVAGVLFTCDPLTGNPGIISITANYGLGESVVSGSSEPDTVILKRDIRNQISLVSIAIGTKSSKIVMDGSGGTVEENVHESKRHECCLSEEMALKLSKIALSVEESYRSARDIEWGILNGEVVMLQSRPVTSGTGETDFEIEHDMDGVTRSENEYMTKQNIGEVMPGAISTLGGDVLMKFFKISLQSPFQRMNENEKYFPSTYYPSGFYPVRGHLMINVIDMVLRNANEMEKTSIIAQSMMVGLFGRILDDPEMITIAKERHMEFKQNMFRLIFVILSSFIAPGRYFRKIEKSFRNFRVPVESFSTAKEMFDDLINRCSDLTEVTACHMGSSSVSSMWNMFMMSTLASNTGGFSTGVYRDFAYLLSTCKNVESADVPAAMQTLAYAIRQNIDPAVFKAMDIQEALKWLQDSSTMAGTKFRDFLSRHGHRCLKEFDLRSVPWGRDPRPLVKLLQGMADSMKSDSFEKKDINMDKILSELSVPLKFKYRLLIKFLLPRCQEGVRGRESSKALATKGVDIWRSGYLRLAELMVREGRIPDQDLLFFFTLEELDELLKTRSPRLISKAFHRRRLFPILDQYIYPEIMKGYPKPLNLENPEVQISEGELTMKGVPVSQGVIRANARVALTLKEAASLKPGEVLITYGTDIGWSPYFPFLGGVVTELGGLISHGAVVAREYGLPCVVGLHGATQQFQTGDFVLLDGNNGTLTKLSKKKTS